MAGLQQVASPLSVVKFQCLCGPHIFVTVAADFVLTKLLLDDPGHHRLGCNESIGTECRVSCSYLPSSTSSTTWRLRVIFVVVIKSGAMYKEGPALSKTWFLAISPRCRFDHSVEVSRYLLITPVQGFNRDKGLKTRIAKHDGCRNYKINCETDSRIGEWNGKIVTLFWYSRRFSLFLNYQVDQWELKSGFWVLFCLYTFQREWSRLANKSH